MLGHIHCLQDKVVLNLVYLVYLLIEVTVGLHLVKDLRVVFAFILLIGERQGTTGVLTCNTFMTIEVVGGDGFVSVNTGD